MESKPNDLERGPHADPAAVRSAAQEARGTVRHAAREARTVASREVDRLIADVEELLRRVTDTADPELVRLRARLQETVATTKKAFTDGAGEMQRRAKEALQAGDQTVRDRAWEAIGIAAVAGLTIGFLAGRR
jgi:ElaB protein